MAHPCITYAMMDIWFRWICIQVHMARERARAMTAKFAQVGWSMTQQTARLEQQSWIWSAGRRGASSDSVCSLFLNLTKHGVYIRGHPFMTSTWRPLKGEGWRSDACWVRGGDQLHEEIHSEN